MPNYVKVLHEGYSSNIVEQTGKSLPFVHANCSCVLVTSESTNVIVDTMTPWDGDRIKESLKSFGLTPDDINYVISTHGHSDHLGNNNLFLKAKHIVGFCVSVGDQYFLHPFEEGEVYILNLAFLLYIVHFILFIYFYPCHHLTYIIRCSISDR